MILVCVMNIVLFSVAVSATAFSHSDYHVPLKKRQPSRPANELAARRLGRRNGPVFPPDMNVTLARETKFAGVSYSPLEADGSCG